MVARLTLLCAALALSGCAETREPPSPAVSDPKAVWCRSNEPVRPSRASLAAMTEKEIDDALERNRRGAAWCGWRP